MPKQIFEKVRIAAFTTGIVGPLTVRFLSDYGAQVILVESRTRLDAVRSMPPFKDNKPGEDRAGYFTSQNVNKYGITLNLNHPRSKEVTERIVQWADVVAENFAPGVMERFKLNYEELCKIKSEIIMIRMSNQGQTGPCQAMAGYGTHLTALCGFTNLIGWPDREPSKQWGAYTDFVAPRFAAVALIAALDYRLRTGKGQYIDLSQFEASVQLLSPLILDFIVNQRETERQGNRSFCAAPHGVYRCKGEDEYCTIAIFSDGEWQTFCQIIGKPEWTTDARFNTLERRLSNVELLDPLVEECTVKYTPEELMDLLQAAGLKSGIVEKCEYLFDDPQLSYRSHFIKLDHKVIGEHSYPNLAFRLSKNPSKLYRAAPCLGQDNLTVYKSLLGYSEEEISSLIADGVLE